jgi:hypothetical protein
MTSTALFRTALAAAIVSALSLSVARLDAFGDAGHRIIGHVAELRLANTRALKEVRRILKPQETLAQASVWPDVIKDALYEDSETGPFRLEHPAHDTYHYANLPFQASRYAAEVPGARAMDIVQTLHESMRVLRGESTLFTPREALRVLAHLVGDIHQPLHVGNAFVAASGELRFVMPEGNTGWRPTLGGNALVYGPEYRFNLHSYWDTHAVNITTDRIDPAEYARRLVDSHPTDARWKNSGPVEGWPEQWAADALLLARDVHQGIRIRQYLGPDDAKRTAHRWLIEQPANYDDLARERIPRQLAAGGYHLAETLKAIWP